MKANLLDLRRNPGKIVEAIERNETVTLSKRGKEIAVIVPAQQMRQVEGLRDFPAFGMWAKRTDMKDPSKYVRRIRKARFRDL